MFWLNDWTTNVFELCIGEWFNADPQAVVQQALQTGAGPNASDAHTFNGLPGPLYNCSTKGKWSLFYMWLILK